MPPKDGAFPFPPVQSATGAFSDVRNVIPSSGLIPFGVKLAALVGWQRFIPGQILSFHFFYRPLPHPRPVARDAKDKVLFPTVGIRFCERTMLDAVLSGANRIATGPSVTAPSGVAVLSSAGAVRLGGGRTRLTSGSILPREDRTAEGAILTTKGADLILPPAIGIATGAVLTLSPASRVLT